ncbi:magnesium/cobalt transporter CorA [Nocardioides sp. ChNu-153]|uniref:magnesium/cobalt transporter CorA n=1 Tax=Nocardioides sp. ChNu-153 TaxID=2779364 RepID=UPI00264A9B70|nr:magnesium/cobalt transporter CorA [Nocardioides sp. ChNu-153]MDN7122191.1 magnesium/cobalt transporter CorA [Nocardioides sp. ChNu-153]
MIVDNALYRAGRRVEVDCAASDLAGVIAAREPGDFVWVGLFEPDAAEMGEVAQHFGLHPLAVEDAVNAHQRPKLERYDDQLFVVLKTLWYVDAEDAVETGEIAVFVGRDFVVHVRHGAGSELHGVRLDLERRASVLSHGPSAVLYVLCDRVVDDYAEVGTSLEVDVDEVEASVFSPVRTDDTARIYTLKRELAEVRRAVLPLREPLRRIVAGDVDGVADEAAPYFRDVADHLTRVTEVVEYLDGLLAAAFDAQVARISVQQNEDMRRISSGVALVAGPTLVAAVYGMNFDHMPELHWTLGYPMALALMVLISGFLWWQFKRSGWM